MSALHTESEASSSERDPPPNFETIEQIMNMPNERLLSSPLVNVVGFVKDFRPPVKTRGTDYKCTLRIVDVSSQYDKGIELIIFWAEDKMPRISGPLDAVLARKVKVQMYSGRVSLLANRVSEFHIIPFSKIPRSPSISKATLWQSLPPPPACKVPTAVETDYMIWANDHMDKSDLPSSEAFEEKTKQAMNVHDKFSLLQDVKLGKYYNVIGEVIKVHEFSGMVTMYLSDYTANSLFYHYTWAEGGDNPAGRDGDEYGYVHYRPKSTKEWPGPYGKLAIQITLFDEHAEFVRERVKVKQWVRLKNLRVDLGKTGGLLEGYLHGEPDRRLMVQVMEHATEPDGNDPRWKEAVHRKLLWWKKFEKQKKAILKEVTNLGEKRKRGNDDITKINSKMRRKEKRAAAEGKVAALESKATEKLDLNKNIRCSHPDKPTLPLSEIQKIHVSKSGDGPVHTLPFINGNYRANIRVVNFFPDNIEDFAIGRRKSEYDMLSDYSGGEDTDVEGDLRHFRDGKGFAEKTWEWRFALQVQDATTEPSTYPPTSTERLWLTVENEAAQMLLNIDKDATNLREDSHVLSQLREKLYILWGDLEEHKSAQIAALWQKRSNLEQEIPPSSNDTTVPSSPVRRAGEQPDPDSDMENEIQQARQKAKMKTNLKEDISPSNACLGSVVKNKAFTCCIKQYGVKVPEEDPSKANAGDGQRWERKFGLFGTTII